MATISKVEAFIKAAEVMESPKHAKAAQAIHKIIIRALTEDKKTNNYSNHIYLTREEKKLFRENYS